MKHAAACVAAVRGLRAEERSDEEEDYGEQPRPGVHEPDLTPAVPQ